MVVIADVMDHSRHPNNTIKNIAPANGDLTYIHMDSKHYIHTMEKKSTLKPEIWRVFPALPDCWAAVISTAAAAAL